MKFKYIYKKSLKYQFTIKLLKLITMTTKQKIIYSHLNEKEFKLPSDTNFTAVYKYQIIYCTKIIT